MGKKTRKILLEQSENRQKLNELLGQSELSAEQRSDLEKRTNRAQQLEVEYRAALVSEPESGATKNDSEKPRVRRDS